MTQSTWKSLILSGMAIGLLTIGVSQADAFSYWRPWLLGCGVPPTCCCTPGDFACCDPCCACCDPCFACCVGPVRRLLSVPLGWFSPCWGYRWTGCCWDACCEPFADCCAATAPGPVSTGSAKPPISPAPLPTVAPPQSSPSAPGKPAETPLPPEPLKPNNYNPPAPTPAEPGARTQLLPTRASSALLTIWVPADARVMINGLPTQSTGSKREYVSHNLQPGLTYKYEVCAQIGRDGKPLDQTKVVFMTAGANEGVAFGCNPAPRQSVASTY